jgi:hypothetical protein
MARQTTHAVQGETNKIEVAAGQPLCAHRALLFLADLLLKPITFSCRFETPSIVSKVNASGDVESIRLLWTAAQQAVKQRLPPTAAWVNVGGTHEALRDTISNLIAVRFWAGVVAVLVLMPFSASTGWFELLQNYIWAMLMWTLLRPTSCAAATTPMPYFVLIEGLVVTGHSLFSDAKWIFPVALDLVQLAAMVLLAYAIPVRHNLILVHEVLEIATDDEPNVEAGPGVVTDAKQTLLVPVQREGIACEMPDEYLAKPGLR